MFYTKVSKYKIWIRSLEKSSQFRRRNINIFNKSCVIIMSRIINCIDTFKNNKKNMHYMTRRRDLIFKIVQSFYKLVVEKRLGLLNIYFIREFNVVCNFLM